MWLFRHQDKVGNPNLQCNVQVQNVSGSLRLLCFFPMASGLRTGASGLDVSRGAFYEPHEEAMVSGAGLKGRKMDLHMGGFHGSLPAVQFLLGGFGLFGVQWQLSHHAQLRTFGLGSEEIPATWLDSKGDLSILCDAIGFGSVRKTHWLHEDALHGSESS